MLKLIRSRWSDTGYHMLLLVFVLAIIAIAFSVAQNSSCGNIANAQGVCPVGSESTFSETVGIQSGTVFTHTLVGTPTASRTLQFPDKAGTFALLDDVRRSATFTVCAVDADDTAPCDQVADGTADDVQIQAAITACPISGSCLINLSEGTFSITTTIDVPDDDIIIEGRGAGTIITQPNSTDLTFLFRVYGNRNTIRDLRLDGNGGNQASGTSLMSWGRATFTPAEILVDNVYFEDSIGHGFFVAADATHPTVRNSHFTDILDRPINITAETTLTTQSVIVTGNYIEDYDGFGISLWFVDNGIVSNNILDASVTTGGKVPLEAISIQSSQNIVVSGNVIDGTTDSGIVAGDTGNGELANISITGNVSQNNDVAGIRVAVTGTGEARNVSIVGNTVRNNGQDTGIADLLRSGIVIGSEMADSLVVADVAYDDQGVPTQRYGIAFAGDSDHVIVGYNNVRDNIVLGMLVDGSNHVIRDNKGFTTESSGTATITTTSVTITHGLNRTPEAEDCWFIATENPTTDVGTLWVSTHTSTQFNANVEVDPGASDLDIAWRCEV